MKMANTRKPPTEPGNGLGLYTGGTFSGSGVGGGCTYENPTQEKIGHSVARICLYYSYLYHLIVSLVMLMLPLLFWGGQMKIKLYVENSLNCDCLGCKCFSVCPPQNENLKLSLLGTSLDAREC